MMQSVKYSQEIVSKEKLIRERSKHATGRCRHAAQAFDKL